MKVKMTETFQGRDVTALHVMDGINVSILEAGEEYQVNDSLGAWLIENYKAKEVHKPAQIKPEVVEIFEPVLELAEPEPAKIEKKRGRK